MAVFPKDRSADHLWSTNILNLVHENFFEQKTCRILAKICFMLKNSGLEWSAGKIAGPRMTFFWKH